MWRIGYLAAVIVVGMATGEAMSLNGVNALMSTIVGSIASLTATAIAIGTYRRGLKATLSPEVVAAIVDAVDAKRDRDRKERARRAKR